MAVTARARLARKTGHSAPGVANQYTASTPAVKNPQTDSTSSVIAILVAPFSRGEPRSVTATLGSSGPAGKK